MSLFGGAARFVDRQARRVVRTVKKVPVAGHAVKLGEKAVKGPVATTIQKIAKNPVVSVVAAPVAIPTNLGIAAARGGVQGAAKAAKEELKNPVRRVVIKAVGTVFPPVEAAGKALDAANKVVAASESKDPVEAAKAAAAIGAAEALAEVGDVDAKRVVATIDQAKKLRAAASPSKLGVGRLTDLWHADEAGQVLFGAKHRELAPGNVKNALSALHKVSALKVGDVRRMKPAERARAEKVTKKAAGLVSAVLAGVGRYDSEFLAELGLEITRDLAAIERDGGPQSKQVLALVETLMAQKSSAQTKELNRFVLALNSGDAKEKKTAQTKLAKLKRGHAEGHPQATSNLNALRQRTAALKCARKYRVDGSGMVRKK